MPPIYFDEEGLSEIQQNQIRWFVNDKSELHWYYDSLFDCRCGQPAQDGESHFSDGFVLSVKKYNEDYDVVELEDDGEYLLPSVKRDVGEIHFFHWRHGHSVQNAV